MKAEPVVPVGPRSGRFTVYVCILLLVVATALLGGCSGSESGQPASAAAPPAEPSGAAPSSADPTAQTQSAPAQPAPEGGLPRVAGPFTHANLSFYLLTGEHQPEHDHLLTLQEAMERKLVKVHETGKVSELAVENLSPTRSIFIQAGDIVRGGKQDRTLGVDMIVAANSGRVPIASFCVERGRWSQRGGENLQQFSSAMNSLPGKNLKAAARYNKNQDKVWANVAKTQASLSEKVSGRVIADDSVSSMELTMESAALKEKTAKFEQAFDDLLAQHPKATGVVVAINGEISSADVYLSPVLFGKLWPKLSHAAYTEALAEAPATGAGNFKWPAAAEVRAWLLQTREPVAKITTVNATTSEAVRKGGTFLRFDSRDANLTGQTVRMNAIRLTKEEMAELEAATPPTPGR
ncbi:MAG: DUF6569 family protein [Verrucomicrobiota bacterium]